MTDIDLSSINYLAVLLAAVSMFLVGGIWYQALFAKQWMKENGFTADDIKNSNPQKTFGGSLLLSLISAFILAMFIGADSNVEFGTFAGLMVGLWVACAFGINYLFEMKSFRLFLINASYNIVAFTVMGAIIGAWL
jgi:hypothetical protein